MTLEQKLRALSNVDDNLRVSADADAFFVSIGSSTSRSSSFEEAVERLRLHLLSNLQEEATRVLESGRTLHAKIAVLQGGVA